MGTDAYRSEHPDVGGGSAGAPKGRPLIGRDKERQLVAAALRAGRPVLLVGPPGTSKTSVLATVVADLLTPDRLFHATGDDQLSIHSLVGSFDPPAVLREGYVPKHFLAGPLTRALQTGGILYLEELNRAPTGTLNALLTALSDGYVDIPRYGRVSAAPGFGFVAASNPLDDVGTERLSRGLLDRFVAVHLGYQSRAEEEAIVREHVPGMASEWVEYAVEIARRSREHPDCRFGSSIRGSIDFLRLLQEMRGPRDVLWDAGVAAFATKIGVRPSCGRSVPEVVIEIMRGALPVLGDGPDTAWWAAAGGEQGGGDTQGGARVRAGEDEAEAGGARGGEVSGAPRPRVQMAWQGGTGGARGTSLSRESPRTSDLQFGLTVDERSTTDASPARSAADGEWLLAWIRGQYRRLPAGGPRRVADRMGGRETQPWRRGMAGEIDVEATVANVALAPDAIGPEHIMVRRGNSGRRRFAVLVDYSGSMDQAKRSVAVAVVGLLAYHSAVDPVQYGVYAFDQGLTTVKALAEERSWRMVVEELLHLPEGRSTDLSQALAYAARLSDQEEGLEVILISDCMPTRGEKTFAPLARRARRIPELYICQVPRGAGAGFATDVGGRTAPLDLYGIWALKWVGPERFCSVSGLHDVGQLFQLLTPGGNWV